MYFSEAFGVDRDVMIGYGTIDISLIWTLRYLLTLCLYLIVKKRNI